MEPGYLFTEIENSNVDKDTSHDTLKFVLVRSQMERKQ